MNIAIIVPAKQISYFRDIVGKGLLEPIVKNNRNALVTSHDTWLFYSNQTEVRFMRGMKFDRIYYSEHNMSNRFRNELIELACILSAELILIDENI